MEVASLREIVLFKTKKYLAIKQSYCVVASYRLAAHASMIIGHDNLPVLNCKTKKDGHTTVHNSAN